jgi:hypothetical protein
MNNQGALIKVLLLGTEHLSGWTGPGPEADILSDRRQRELDELVGRLARFEPTKVGVEVLASRQAELDERYRQFLGTEAEPDRNEVSQIGFRLASRLGHSKVFALDADWALEWSGVKDYLGRHPEQDPGEGLSPAGTQLVADARKRIETSSISELLAYANDSPMTLLNDREYLDRFLTIGAGDNWGGVDLVASWYRRNLRIVANLMSLGRSGDRFVVVVGLGHVNSLRHFVSTAGILELAPLTDYLSAPL